MLARLLKIAIVFVGAASSAIGLSGAKTSPSTAGGVYTAEQAAQGGALYAERCAMCHGEKLQGTYEIVPLKGTFLAGWNHAPLGRLFDYVGRAMPQMAPGSSTPDENAAIVAYLLQENGMPVGARPMANEAKTLDSIVIELPKR